MHKSQENPYVKEVYEKVLGEVGGHKAHELLHTSYTGRKRVKNQTITIRNTPHPKIEVCVCVGTNCYNKGAHHILRKMMGHVSKNKLEDIVGFEGQEDMVDVKATFCFERCERGPVVRINDKIIEHATYEIAKEVLYKEIEEVGALLES